MKPLRILLPLLICSLVVGAGCGQRNKIKGVWMFVSSKYTTPDTTIVHTEADWTAIKVITDSYFATVGQHTERPPFGEEVADSDIVAAYNSFSANGGKYALDSDTYTEYLSYFTNPNRVNTSAELRYEIRDNELVLFAVVENVTWEEVWHRLE